MMVVVSWYAVSLPLTVAVILLVGGVKAANAVVHRAFR